MCMAGALALRERQDLDPRKLPFPKTVSNKVVHSKGFESVVYRDVKPSNVLIDGLNAKLGDFGLARTYEHNNDPQTANIVGRLGYLAHELTRTWKATTSTDVYGYGYCYGTLMVEVASRRKPIEPQNRANELVLVDWVRELHSRGEITRAIDPKLKWYHSGEAQLVLTLAIAEFSDCFADDSNDPPYNILTPSQKINFAYNGFLNQNLTLEGASFIKSDGMLVLTNDLARLLGHSFYPSPVQFKKRNPNNNGTAEAVTFSTSFVLSITSKYPDIGGHGLAFVLMPTKKPKTSLANQNLGLPNDTSIGCFLAVEFDIVQNPKLQDINDNHVGIDISSLISNISMPAAYCSSNDNCNNSILLRSGKPVQAWIDYDSNKMLMNVSISPCGMSRPIIPLISFPIDLSSVLDEYMIRDGDEILEDWEIEYGACRFKYSELFAAARGFGEKNFIGSGGFGRVYRGVIPSTGLEVAIKRVYNGSCQGMKEFVAEITSMGRLRHRNLVHLHGWCRKKDKLLLVYDYVPNGSLDKLLDVKPSNVLIDGLNAKLGDFGLATTYEHNNDPQTTNIVSTLEYLAPELTRTGKATTSTDVYGYGTLMLEVASRRRPIEPQNSATELVLVDWVRELYSRGEITRAIDPKLDNYHSGEAQLVLTLGLLCCHPHPDYRPTMRRVVQLLLGDATLPLLPHDIHMEVPMTVSEFSYCFANDSDDPLYQRSTSSQSNNSWISFGKSLPTAHTTRVTF
ncbi:L-type lectin-domain containing receptor kinase IV.2 [Hibiscus syriacus]|uniref:L-type lectin-domain containing receptor kinase IV.2 n=1 Tax=Hibiscus syriacus TaxID=106335 RepID=A0A6A3BYM6_HIBSY|nr:L-type lectin-domain containing receptor kinase IV.2 [Hibiscus syriacus]